MENTGDTGRMLRHLLQAAHTVTLEQLPGLIAGHADSAGLYDVAVFAVDLRETVLRQITGRGLDAAAGGEEVRIDGTLPGRAYQRVTVVAEAPREAGARRRWWVPVTDGVERIGVLRADSENADEAAVRQDLRDLASLVALVVLSKRSCSDSFARLVRTEPMNVAAEMQWKLMPPTAFAGQDVTVGGVSEPAYEMGGDAFDYAVSGNVLHLSVFDAMGHDTTAGITANVAVSACRNARRQGASLAETSRAVESVLVAHFGTSRYVTGILADLDLDTGRLTWINRGHPLPLVIRDNRWTVEPTCPPAGPMGTCLGLPIVVCRQQLEPGDRLLMYTDGIVEARNFEGQRFGRERFVDFVVRHHSGRQTLHETLRRLMHAVLDHHSGRLEDDATVLLTEWRAGHQDRLTP
ncbi:serine phosphatase RsbU (regulator of sigma subunit) [Streptomyces sp. SAI-135]|uniref:PP2C family protein-serine/threonine phosphatase n=1 Tax=unclassified Streptomyces TaxID=2593676 RepID=UPI002475D64E|nr:MULTISPECIES: PP2C family protein-serine/threonine phosphatase [unclassified Streptomyces]MDH6514975.1 serine phosphatase RsbU (regulator of sigma subunit) [Streptomyces sp. SAI-090]MDH6547190.1 serine phosphatase RsbU (regulator of sigma subunit) [Streptomyces sp. SAI-041]MDH6620941.1 serine phosphatase RsbU (regulator of sigma subunit) [Streptomyces sp. SAI-135]